MRALVERSLEATASYSVNQVICDQPAAAGVRLARDLGVPTRLVVKAKETARAAYEAALAGAIEESPAELIVLAGFMRILSAPFVERFADKILNIHPSLLPKYPGLHTHRRALAAHESEHGATVHFVTEQLDGGPAVLQARVPVAAGDTEATLSQRVLTQEHRIYPLAVGWFCEGRLKCVAGAAWLDGVALRQPVQV